MGIMNLTLMLFNLQVHTFDLFFELWNLLAFKFQLLDPLSLLFYLLVKLLDCE